MTVVPEFPIYIISKGRAGSRLTSKALETMGVPYKIVVERQERDEYATVIDPAKILVLDPNYQRDYDAFDDLGDTKSKGSGPARNFVWDHAVASGHKWHWIMDDNIQRFYRYHKNIKIPVADGAIFAAMEGFVQRYTNVLMAGPNYDFFVPRKKKKSAVTLNARIYSCNLIRNDAPFRWRGRYNEDTDLSLRILKAGWVTVLFNAFLQKKITTLTMTGGNAEIYANEGILLKTQMLIKAHPDVTKISKRFGRWHHYVDYRPFKNNMLRRRPDIDVPHGVDNYGMVLKHIAS